MGQQSGMKIRCVGGPRHGYETIVPLGLIDLALPITKEPITEPFSSSFVIEPPRYHAYRARGFGGELVHVNGVVLFYYC